MAISALNIYVAGQNGNTEITVLPVGVPSGPVQPNADFLARPPTEPPLPMPAPSAAVRVSGPELGPQGVSLSSLVERFKSESRHLAAATRQKFDSHFKVAGRYLDFDRDVASIKLADMRLLKSKLSEGRKPSTVNDILFKALGALFKIAGEDDLIDRSPLEKLAHSRKVEPDRQQPLWEQSQEIVDSIRTSSSETGVIAGFMRNFGVGQAEIKYLLGENIDTDAGVIHFRRKKTGKQFDVPIFPHAQPFIQTLKAEGRLQVGRPVVAWRNPRKALASACERLDLPSYEPRALRRCFIVHCLQTGIDPRLVAKWQGHRDAKLIFSVYGKFIDRDYELAQAERLGMATAKAVATGNMTARPC
jgi:integrase